MKKMLMASASFLIFMYCIKKVSAIMSDPLLQSGLSIVEIRIYRYLLALEDLSRFQRRIPITVNADTVRSHILKNPVAICPSCERWYLAEVMTCPADNDLTEEISIDLFTKVTNEWEIFRRDFTRKVGKHVSRSLAVRMHYLTEHTQER